MAWGRKKTNGRREPMFGLAASLSELRLGPQDRVTVADDKPKAKASKAKTREPDRGPPRQHKPREDGKRKSARRSRGLVYRLLYWGPVHALWTGIVVVAVVVWVGPHRPG